MKNKYFIFSQNRIKKYFKRAVIRYEYYAKDARPDLTYEICSHYEYEVVYNSIIRLIKKATYGGLTKEQRNVLFERLIKRHKRLVHLYIDYLRECECNEIQPFKGGNRI